MSLMMASVGLSVASSILGSRSASKEHTAQAKAEARKAGKNNAQAEFSAMKQRQALPQRAAAVEEEALNAKAQVNLTEAADVAAATVEAAASGTAGTSVDQTAQSIEASAANVEKNLRDQRRAGLLQINQDYEDLYWEETAKKYSVETTGGQSTGTALASAALAGMGAYIGARGSE